MRSLKTAMIAKRVDCKAASPEAAVMPRSYWRPIHYLGSKLRIAEEIRTVLNQVDPRLNPVCDLFAGSGTVSAALATDREVTAVDIQEYSRVLCRALLNPLTISPEEVALTASTISESSIYRSMLWAAQPLIDAEERCIEKAEKGNAKELARLLEETPLVLASNNTRLFGFAFNETARRLRTLHLDKHPSSVTLRYFGGVYFSYRQSVQLAALLEYAQCNKDETQDILLAASMSTASEIVNTIGKQFAQPIRIRNSDSTVKMHVVRQIIRDRQLDALNSFHAWLDRYSRIPKSARNHRVFRGDFSEALMRHCDNVGIVYADPPYTRDHYSRFYHVLETMCLGDEPAISVARFRGKTRILRGIYRVDRHQSPFCIKSQAPQAFAVLFRGVRRLGIPLVLSYSPLAETKKPRPRVMEITDLMRLARKCFTRVESIPAGRISHNKLNKSVLNSELSHDAELFLVCS